MKKQYTIREDNEWEGEIFNYVVYLTVSEMSEILEKCNKYGDDTLTIKETNYTNEEITKLNKKSGNTYMDFIAPYALIENAIADWEEFGYLFYKGNGLIRLNKLEYDNIK